MRLQEGRDIRAAVASKTDEPQWARICLDHLVLMHDERREGITFYSLGGLF